jgi:hypothetical protein
MRVAIVRIPIRIAWLVRAVMLADFWKAWLVAGVGRWVPLPALQI